MIGSKNLCERCQSISFDALGQSNGQMHHTQVRMLIAEAERESGCSLCALLWWSLRYDRFRIDDSLPVMLYLNPPFMYSAKPQQLEVVVARPERLANYGWAPGLGDEPWQLGPPEYVPEVIRGHLTLHGLYGLKSHASRLN